MADVPMVQQAAILVRAMSYDRALKARAGGRVDLLVLATPREAASRDAAKAFATLEGLNVQGVPLHVEEAAASDEGELAAVLEAKQPDAVYLAPGLEGLLEPLRRAARARGFLTIASRPAQVEAGLALGLDVGGARPVLVINMREAQAQRVDFGSDVLKLARVIR